MSHTRDLWSLVCSLARSCSSHALPAPSGVWYRQPLPAGLTEHGLPVAAVVCPAALGARAPLFFLSLRVGHSLHNPSCWSYSVATIGNRSLGAGARSDGAAMLSASSTASRAMLPNG